MHLVRSEEHVLNGELRGIESRSRTVEVEVEVEVGNSS